MNAAYVGGKGLTDVHGDSAKKYGRKSARLRCNIFLSTKQPVHRVPPYSAAASFHLLLVANKGTKR
jgi:hypothetical protein